ncbi:MAG TPA: glycosyltransferase [Candidatus Gracilibacteria bacterium]|nr:glycosyltransferase [Candidatus Gracilibacteria bacterium]
MTQKKILFYTDTPIYGGAERIMLELARNLNREKYSVMLACSKYKILDEWCEHWEQNGMQVARLNVIHKHDPRHHLQLKKILKKERPDILHLHLWNPGSCRYAFGAVDKKTTKLISTEHDPFPLNGIKNMLKKKGLKKTDCTIAVSDANRELLLKLYPDLESRIVTIHNGIDLEHFEKQLLHFSSQKKAKIRSDLMKAAHNDFVIVSVAALHPRKGLKHVIEAFAEIKKEAPQTKLVIVGEGPQRKELTECIKKLGVSHEVMLLGKQENIPEILKSSDLFVLPSVKEAFGIAVLEAMAAQLPIIASGVGGIPEIIKNNRSGLLVEPGNTEALKTAIQELMKNQPLSQKLAFVAHHEVKNFDVKTMARRTEAIYDGV